MLIKETDVAIMYMDKLKSLENKLEATITTYEALYDEQQAMIHEQKDRIIYLEKYKTEYNYITGNFNVSKLIEEVAPLYNVDPNLLKAMTKVESTNRHRARSRKGAKGLMQLMPYTARKFGVTDAYHPVQNIHGGARYVRYLMSYYEGNVDLVLAAYNAGETQVERYRGVPPFQETRRYIKKVRKYYKPIFNDFDKIDRRRSRIVRMTKLQKQRGAG